MTTDDYVWPDEAVTDTERTDTCPYPSKVERTCVLRNEHDVEVDDCDRHDHDVTVVEWTSDPWALRHSDTDAWWDWRQEVASDSTLRGFHDWHRVNRRGEDD